MFVKCKKTWSYAIGLAFLLSLPAFAGKPGKGGGPGGGGEDPPPVQAPVNYILEWLHNPWGPEWEMQARDINDAGTVTGFAYQGGYSSAFLSAAGKTVSLNELGATWTDLDAPEEPAVGWCATSALRINEPGQIIGTAVNTITSAERAFVLSFPAEAPPEFTLLPSLGLGRTFGVDINDLGVAIATSDVGYIVYVPGMEPQLLLDVPPASSDKRGDLNNYGEFVNGRGVYIAPGENYDYSNSFFVQETDYQYQGINDSGVMCGARDSVKGKNGQQGGPLRRAPFPDGSVQMLAPVDSYGWAGGINQAGDVCFNFAGRGYLYTDLAGEDGQPLGALPLDDLIVFQDADAELEWKSASFYTRELNNPDSTGFGQICGWSNASGVLKAFILTPDPVQAP